jgi:hypothetical protein
MANSGRTRVFCSYAHADAEIRDELAKHLNLLQEAGVIQLWHDAAIAPGDEWEKEIQQQLQVADVILLLVSIDLLNSTVVKGRELPIALKRHKDGTAIVVPVIIRPVHWSQSGLAFLQALPEDLRPVTLWVPRDSAYVNICEGLVKAILSWQRGRPRSPDDDSGSVGSVTRRRVLDVGLPREVPVLKPTVLAMMIRRPDRPGLRGAFELQTRYSLQAEEVESTTFKLEFPKSEGKLDPIDLTVYIETTDFHCTVNEKRLAIPPHGDSPIVVFIVEALRSGSLLANLSISQAGRRIAELLLRTDGIDGSSFRPEVQHSVALDVAGSEAAAGAPTPPKRDSASSRTPPIPEREVIAMSVQFDLCSPDGLRRARVRLDKDSDGNAAAWNINYTLHEREKRTEPFDEPIGQVDVEVQRFLHPKAEKAAREGLTPAQAAYAIGPAADDVKGYIAGELRLDVAQKSVEDILRQR